MDRCPICDSDQLERFEWLEVSLFGDAEQVAAMICLVCGWVEPVSSEIVAV